MVGRYDAKGPEAESEPGSRGRVLRNRVGITSVREIEAPPPVRCALTSPPFVHDKRVARAPAGAGVLAQRATLDQIQDVAVGSVLRGLCQLGPL